MLPFGLGSIGFAFVHLGDYQGEKTCPPSDYSLLTASAQRWNSPEALLSALTDVNHRTLVALLNHVSTCSHGLPVPEIGGCSSSLSGVSNNSTTSSALSWGDFTLTTERVTKGRDISVCRALHLPTGTKVTLMLTPPKALPVVDFLLERSVVASNGLQPGHTVLVLPQSQIRTLAEFSVHCDVRSALYVMLQLCKDLQSLQSQGVESVVEAEQRILVASWDQLAYLLFMYKKAPVGCSPHHIPLHKFALSIFSELESAKKHQALSGDDDDAVLTSNFALIADLLRRNELDLCQRVIEFNLWQAPRDPLAEQSAFSTDVGALLSSDAERNYHEVGNDKLTHSGLKSNSSDDDIESLADALDRWLALQKAIAVQKNSGVRDPHAKAAQSKMAKPATPCSVFLEYQLQFLTTASGRSLADCLAIIRRYEASQLNDYGRKVDLPRDDNNGEELYADYRFC
ncbi:hypothetical protein BIW11_06274 [Tropilaelaps mercedesae]|uniref:Uncharacterized protein n=1 Tax=Tropilaelaps mercedesae TaxID=418985 RepID=A0A1V9XYS4_9ACAR|nr:hypothetical protein BIW11_06274 [Tropilaelaps mercedesae]